MPICEKCQKSFATTYDCQVMEDCICGMEFVREMLIACVAAGTLNAGHAIEKQVKRLTGKPVLAKVIQLKVLRGGKK